MSSFPSDRMSASQLRGWTIVLCFVALMLPSGAQSLTISLAPLGSSGPVSIAIGETIRLKLIVEDVPAEGLAAFQVELIFDPNSIQLADPNAAFITGGIDPFVPLGGNVFCDTVRGESCQDPGWFLMAPGRTAVLATAEIDNVLGRTEIAYGTHGSGVLPSGAGVLALIDITGVALGAIQIQFGATILANASETNPEYDTTSLDFGVTVVPEPSTALLVGGGLVGLAWWCKRRPLRG